MKRLKHPNVLGIIPPAIHNRHELLLKFKLLRGQDLQKQMNYRLKKDRKSMLEEIILVFWIN